MWQWLGKDENYKALSIVFTVLTFIAVVVFGILGISKAADISVNLRELKADSIEAERVQGGKVLLEDRSIIFR